MLTYNNKILRNCFVVFIHSFHSFRTPVLRLLLDLDTYGGVDPLGVFLLLLKMVADIIDPKLSIIFCRLIRRGSFPECLRSANVTAIPKGPPSHDRENFRPISITPILSKVYEKLVSHGVSSFCEKYIFFLLLNLLTGKVWAARMHC